MRVALGALLLALTIGASAAIAEPGADPTAIESPSFLSGFESQGELEGAIENASRVDSPPTDPQAAEELPREDLDRGEAEELLTAVFPVAMEEAAGIYDDLEVEAFRSDHVALVTPDGGDGEGEAGQPGLLTSLLPLRTETAEGTKEIVDLSLEQEQGGLAPANPIVEVEIPANLSEGISLPETGVEINLVGAPEARVPSTPTETSAFYPNVAADSDLTVAPTPTGVETHTQLRSPDAPTTQTFRLGMPNGASLTETEDGGARVSAAGETLVSILAPTAVDAEGDSVPASLEVVGSTIVVRVEPADDDLFPILVDPVFDTYAWQPNQDASAFGEWRSTNGPPFVWATNLHNWWGTMKYGLNLRSDPGPLAAPTQATWNYYVPRYFGDYQQYGVLPDSFIKRMELSEVYFTASESPAHAHPFFLMGILDEAQQTFLASTIHYGNEGTWTNPGKFTLPNGNDNANVKNGGIALVSWEPQSYPHVAMVGQAVVELSDKSSPNMDFLGGTGWLNQSPTPISYSASDSGLGVYEMQVSQPKARGGSSQLTTSAQCVGNVRSPCPRVLNAAARPLSYEPKTMPQGENFVKVTAADPVAHVSAAIDPSRVKVDHTAPKLASLAGTLTEQATLGAKLSQYTLKYNASDGDETPPEALAPFGGAGSGEGKTGRPLGIAADGKGSVWVVDRENNRVMQFDESGKFISQFGSKGSGNGQLLEPRGIAISPKGTLWVTDTGNYRVQEFTTSGQYLQQFGSQGTGPSQFQEVYGITAAPDGTLWVSDMGRNRVAAFREVPTSGQNPYFVREAEGRASGNNKTDLLTPNLMAVDSFGNLWVADAGHHRIQEFDANGQFLTQFGTAGTEAGQLSWPGAIAIASSGHLLVVDNANNRIQEFMPDGSYLRQFGSTGTGNAQFSEPRGIALAGNVAFVADAGNHRIPRWAHADKDPQSGVAKGEIQVDGAQVDVSAPGCATKNCTLSREWTLNADNFTVGPHTVEVIVTDGVGLTSSKTISIETHGDRVAPTIALSGSMTEQAALGTTRPTYKLSLVATDPGSAEERQSGVVSTTVKVDGKVVDSAAPGCPAGGCSVSREWTLKSDSYSVGSHSVEATATDAAGRTATKSLTINIARDTTAPELTATNALFTAPGGWLEQKSYAYVPSASDVNGYGVTSLVFKIDGVTVASTTQSCENGGCGTALLGKLNVANYEGGSHPAELKVTDGAGNWRKRAWTINVNPKGEIDAEELEATLEAVDDTSDANTVGPSYEDPEYEGTASGLEFEEVGSELLAEGTLAPVAIDTDSEDPTMVVEIPDDTALDPGCEEGGATEVPQNLTAAEEEALAAGPSGTCVPIEEPGLDGEPQLESVEIAPIDTDPEATDIALDDDDSAAMSANVDEHVDMVTRPLVDGGMTFTTIRNTTGSETYSFRVDLEPEQTLKLIDPQHAAVYWDDEHPAFGIAAVAAHDAIGSAVPTSLSVSNGNIVTLTVSHHVPSPAGGSFIFPVVAGTGWQGGFQTFQVIFTPNPGTEEGEEAAQVGTNSVRIAAFGPPIAEPQTSATRQLVAEGSVTNKRFKFLYCRPKEIPHAEGTKPEAGVPWRPLIGGKDLPKIVSECSNPDIGGIFWAIWANGTYHFIRHEFVWVFRNEFECHKNGALDEQPAKVNCGAVRYGPEYGPMRATAHEIDIVGNWRFPPGHGHWEIEGLQSICFFQGGEVTRNPEKKPEGATIRPMIWDYVAVWHEDKCNWQWPR